MAGASLAEAVTKATGISHDRTGQAHGYQPTRSGDATGRTGSRVTVTARRPLSPRQQQLLGLLRDQGFVAVSEMAARFGVSEMTVRRDMRRLEEVANVQRLYGGAVVPGGPDNAGEEPSFVQRQTAQAEAKRAIARKAAELVSPGATIGIDVGTTTYELARMLLDARDLNVFTNSLRTGLLLAASSLSVYMPGGRVRRGEGSLTGTIAVSLLQEYRLDQAFLGVSGITADGLYDYSLEDSEVKRVYVRQASQVIVLADATKLSRTSAVRICGLDAVDVLITDAEPAPTVCAALQAAGVRVIVTASDPGTATERGRSKAPTSPRPG
jgi:DeoR/GlpR family transcriptional regulator of sugar metabolism